MSGSKYALNPGTSYLKLTGFSSAAPQTQTFEVNAKRGAKN